MAILRSSVARAFRRSFCASASSSQSSAATSTVKHFSNQLASADRLYQNEENHIHKKVIMLIVNALRLGDRDKASMLLWNHMPKPSKSEVDEFNHILQYCARSPDPLFAMETWKFMEDNSFVLDNICWLYIIQALSEGGHLKEAFNILSSLGDTGRATVPMYNSYLSGCIKSRNLDQAIEGLQLMDTQIIGKSEATYLLLLELAVWQKNLSLVHNISRDLQNLYQPSLISLQKFIWAYSTLGDLKSATSSLRHMTALVTEESVLYNSTRGHFSYRFDIPIPTTIGLADGDRHPFTFPLYPSRKANKEMALGTDSNISLEDNNSFYRDETSEVPSLKFTQSFNNDTEHSLSSDSNTTELYNPQSASCLNSNPLPSSGNCLSAAGQKLLQQSFFHLLRGCIKWKYSDLAGELFLQMNDLGLEPVASSYDALVRAIVPEKGVYYGRKLIDAMMKRNLKPYDTTIGALIVGHSKALEIELAEELLCQIDRKSLFLCNALLDAYRKLDKPERALWLLKRMKQWDAKADTKTYEVLFTLFGKVNSPYEDGDDFSRAEVKKRIHVIETDMITNGVSHNSYTLENMIRALGLEGMTGEVLQYLSMAETLFSSSYPGTLTYNIALQAHVIARDSNAAIGLFNKMRSFSIPPDAATYNIMLDCCSILRTYKYALALVSSMIRSGYLPTALTYSTLMKTVLTNEDFTEVFKLLDQALVQGLEVDVHMFSTVIQEAAMKGFLDVMELILEQMHRLRIPPNPSICANVFLAYANHGLHTTAAEAIRVLSMRMISEDEHVLQEQRSAYDDLLHRDDDEEAASVDKFLVHVFFNSDGEALGTALMSLRWCAMLGMDVSWRPSESPWAKRLAANQYLSR